MADAHPLLKSYYYAIPDQSWATMSSDTVWKRAYTFAGVASAADAHAGR
jgi:hypothetical protein